MSEFNFDKFMGNLKGHASRLKDDAEKLTKNMVKKTNSLVGCAKLNYALNETEDKIKEILIELGRLVYEEYTVSDGCGGEIADKCERINVLYREADELKDKIAQLKNAVRCPACGEQNPSTNAYCSACGEKIVSEPEDDGTAEDDEEDIVD